MRLLEKLTDDKPVIKEKGKEEPEVTILRRNETGGGEDSLKEKADGKEVVQSLVDKIPDDILERTRVRKKKVAFKEEAEHLGLEQESGEWPTVEEDAEEKKLSGECGEWDEDSEKSSDDQDSLCMILAEEKMRHREYSENVLITDSDFFLSDRTSAICITADMSFKSRLEADFKREYQNVEFLFRQRPGLGGMAALPPSVTQVPGKYMCFLVTRVNERNTIDPEHVMLALTRLRDFMIERGIAEVSMPVYDPNRSKLSPRELYATLHVVFAEMEIMVHLHKKYYLSIA